MPVFGVFPVLIFPHAISVFRSNVGENGPEKLRIRTLFMQQTGYGTRVMCAILLNLKGRGEINQNGKWLSKTKDYNRKPQ